MSPEGKVIQTAGSAQDSDQNPLRQNAFPRPQDFKPGFFSSTPLDKSEHLVGIFVPVPVPVIVQAIPNLVLIPAITPADHLGEDSSPAHFPESTSVSDLE
jgi:hypothetical protein